MLFTTSPLAEREVYALQTAGITIVELPAPKSIEDYGGLYGTIAAVFSGEEAGKAASARRLATLKAPPAALRWVHLYM